MKFRIGTRSSALALAQTDMVAAVLKSLMPNLEIEIVHIKTLGDRKQGTAQASQSDKKDWIIDLEQALLRKDIEIAVHSGKDVPADLEAGTKVSPVLERANPQDAFIGKRLDSGQRLSFKDVPQNALIGTASLRRRACLKRHRPDVTVVEHRGNVPTRIQKLDEKPELSGIILACAGLERLKLPGVIWEPIPTDIFIPAMNQGTLVVQYLAENEPTQKVVQRLYHPSTVFSFAAERACAQVLGGDCKSAISIFAELEGDNVVLRTAVMMPDGSRSVFKEGRCPKAKAAELGHQIGQELMHGGAGEILALCSNT